jgi:alcohol dehydrogenase
MIGISEFSVNRIVLGVGAVEKLGSVLQGLGIGKVLIVTDRFMAEKNLVAPILRQLEKGGVDFDVFTGVEPNPTERNAEDCGRALIAGKSDCVIGFGGGSSMDVAKAGAILVTNPPPVKRYLGLGNVPVPGIPVIAIPTTSGTGSETTNIAILKDDQAGTKGGIISPHVIPRVAIVDPALTLSLPPRLTASTGMDALCHAVEGYTSLKATPFTDIFHREAIRRVARSLRTAVLRGDDIDARCDMSLAATLTGTGLVVSSATAVHAMAYALEGNFQVAHGDACAALLPAVAKFNAGAEVEKFRDIAVLMGENVDGLPLRGAALMAADTIRALAQEVGIPTLGKIGVREEDLERLSTEAFSVRRLMENNPRILTVDDVKSIFRDSL